VQWWPERTAPSRSAVKALSAAPVVVCGGIQHNGVLCKAHAPGMKPPAHRVRIRGRYVLRPSGKYRHTSQSQIPSPLSRGSKTGLMIRRPSAFYCLVGCAVYLACLSVVAARVYWQQKCILFIAATSRRRHEPKAPSPSRHRCRVRVVRVNKKPCRTKPPAPAFYCHTPPLGQNRVPIFSSIRSIMSNFSAMSMFD